MKKTNHQVIIILAIIFFVCSVIEYIEFLFMRTDQTIIADNVFTKIACIIAVIIATRLLGFKFSDLGFKKKGVFKYIGYGLGLGILTFAFSYCVEMIILHLQGKSPLFSLYITNFGLSGATSEVSLSAIAVIICIIVNIINVIAEEGLFRGLILKTVSERWGFKAGNFVQALLFGVWHIVICVLGVYDKQMSIFQAIIFAVGYVILAGILAIEWGTCVTMTGVLWVGIAEHFFNNFIGNILHVQSTSGMDELQIVRIVLSNILSLAIVIIMSRIKQNSKKELQM